MHFSWLLWGGVLGDGREGPREDGAIHRNLGGGYQTGGYWSGAIGRPAIAVARHSDNLFETDGLGIFRLGSRSRKLDDIVAETDSDGDGVPDIRDAFPVDPKDWLDTDGDGIGNSRDSDADGDGVDNDEDGVPLDRYEIVDTDGDGTGDDADIDDDGDLVLDVFDDVPTDRSVRSDLDGDGVDDATDDDNDGIPDVSDEEPLVGIREPGLLDLVLGALATRVFENLAVGRAYDPLVWHEAQPADVTYPEGRGTRQRFAQVMLGDVASFSAQLMLDEFELPAVAAIVSSVYFDRNANYDLTDDGPPYTTAPALESLSGILLYS